MWDRETSSKCTCLFPKAPVVQYATMVTRAFFVSPVSAKVRPRFMSSPKKKPSSFCWVLSSTGRLRQRDGDTRALVPRNRGTLLTPLLNIPIGIRLTLGFFIPALIAAFILSSVGMQNQQRLTQEATFSQHLLNAYTSLIDETSLMQQMQN